MLSKAVEFKNKFYRCSWADYENARPTTMKLMPKECFIDSLKDDYEHMKNMIYGEKPDFDILLDGIKQLEKEINSIK